ncbi:hypothetical protein MKX03_011321 [Papaver bracteatum]|nr:hypothetical protein MKX03_011321 [Papaver bracteatum]
MQAAPHKTARSTGGVTKPCRYRRPGIATPRKMCKIMEHGAKVTCHSRPNCIKDYTRELDGTYLKLLEESCFGHLIHLSSLSFCPNVVHNVLLRRKDKEEEGENDMSFIIGNQEICFGKREFAMMSGLKFQGSEEIDENPERIPLMEAHFPGQDNVKLGDLVEKFYQLQNCEDKLKLGLLSIAEGVIMGNGLHKRVNKGHFLLVDNLEEFNNYPWGKLSYKATMSSLIRASKLKHVSKAKHTLGKMVYNLYGFPHVFQAWIFHSIPSLKEDYTIENKDCSQNLYPRILHLEVPRIQVTLHKQFWKELSRLDIKVLSPLHPTQEELKQCYMAGLLSEGGDSGVRGHESVSGIKELNGEAEANAQWEANHYSSPTNSSRICLDQQKKKQILNLKSNSQLLKKVDKKIGTTTKECITLSNDEDEDVESLENLKLKLGSEIEILKKERDIESLNKKKTTAESDLRLCCEQKKKLQCDFEILYKEKTTMESDIELLNKKKTTLGSEIELLSLEKSEMETGLQFGKDESNKLCGGIVILNREKILLGNDIELLNKEKTKMYSDIESLNNEKTILGADIRLLNGKKTIVQDDICSLNEKKITVQDDILLLNEKKTMVHDDICSLKEKKTTVQDDICSLYEKKTTVHEEKTKLGTDVVLLKKRKCEVETDFELLQDEKNKLHSDIEVLNKEKAKIGTDLELSNKEKDKLQNEVELLNNEKVKLQSDVEFFKGEKAEFIRSVTSDVSKSFYEREKTCVENEKMFIGLKEMNQTLVAKERCYAEELREARQELIKVMESEKVTINTVIGVKKRKRGDPELWNFREKNRATLKEVISFQLNHTDK